MKKTLSLAEQVKAARAEVESWPESVRSATEFRHSDFFHCAQDESTVNAARPDQTHHKESVLEA